MPDSKMARMSDVLPAWVRRITEELAVMPVARGLDVERAAGDIAAQALPVTGIADLNPVLRRGVQQDNGAAVGICARTSAAASGSLFSSTAPPVMVAVWVTPALTSARLT